MQAGGLVSGDLVRLGLLGVVEEILRRLVARQQFLGRLEVADGGIPLFLLERQRCCGIMSGR